MLTVFYATMGNPPDALGALAAMAAALSSRATPEAVSIALDLCMTETYPVRLPHILAKLPGTEQADKNAAKRVAWDDVEKYVRKFVGNDSQGNYGPDFGWFGPLHNSKGEIVKAATYPELPQRILDTVRRTGGWRVYARMTDEDFPHQQKRFFEEWEAWNEIERLENRHQLLEMPRAKHFLEGKEMP